MRRCRVVSAVARSWGPCWSAVAHILRCQCSLRSGPVTGAPAGEAQHWQKGWLMPCSGRHHARFRQRLSLAQYPDVFMKIRALGANGPHPLPFPEPMRFPKVPPCMRLASKASGANRLRWGSDVPPVAGRESYHNARDGTMQHMAFRSDDDTAWMCGKTAPSLCKFAAS